MDRQLDTKRLLFFLKYIENYREIYIKVSMHTLKKRDQKGLYSGKTNERNTDVMGIHIIGEEPMRPDLILENDGEILPGEQADRIMEYFAL